MALDCIFYNIVLGCFTLSTINSSTRPLRPPSSFLGSLMYTALNYYESEEVALSFLSYKNSSDHN